MTRVMMIGAHGRVARLALPLLVAGGHDVAGIIRNPEHESDIAATGAVPVVLDIENASATQIAAEIGAYDVVVWSAGAGGGDPGRTDAVDRDAAMRTVDAAVAVAVPPRLVMVSYFGAGPGHGVPADSSFFAYAEAKSGADEHLRASSLDWTILRPSGLTDDPATGLIETGEGVTGGRVPRADVARVIAAVVSHPATTARRTLAFNGGDQDIDAVVAAGRG